MVNAPGTLNHQACVKAGGIEVWFANASGATAGTNVTLDNYPQLCGFGTTFVCFYNGHEYVYVTKSRPTDADVTNSGPACAIGLCPGAFIDTGYDVVVGAHSMNPPQPPPTIGPIGGPLCTRVGPGPC